MTYVFEGKDLSALVSNNTRTKRSADWRWIQDCVGSGIKGVIGLESIKGAVNLFKAGKFEAAYAVLVKAVGAKTLGMAAAIGLLSYCALKPIPVS